eukprot:CAMPEP_0171346970 /NCGR_PEP_ID=MMETSP0878-20121228/26505_1 /TAXON_ID=67004 /ORGANISM="Thalassiosira weissflogii, Strain CCMP1336" /LENGTH=57 /DNA_ID=CAMNT_0011850841 /DNA_START=401 /DNA_END=574 /DNA_ORIENTATION=-
MAWESTSTKDGDERYDLVGDDFVDDDKSYNLFVHNNLIKDNEGDVLDNVVNNREMMS